MQRLPGQGINFTNTRPVSVTMTPDLLFGQIWLESDVKPNNVQIIELNSSNDSTHHTQTIEKANNAAILNQTPVLETDNSGSKSSDDGFNYRDALNKLKNARLRIERECEYMVNEARERCRQGNKMFQTQDALEDDNTIIIEDLIRSDGGNGFYYNERIGLNDINCLKILNNHLMWESDSLSSIGSDNIETVKSHNKSYDRNIYTNVYDFNITEDSIYNPNKSTTLVYSYKNDKMEEYASTESTDNDSSTTSFSSDYEETSYSRRRVATPIPTYIPRLDLTSVSQLTTVTEVTESFLKSPANIEPLYKNVSPVSHKQENNWLKIKNSNIIQWMSLSPRENRRYFMSYVESKLPTLREVCSREENLHKLDPNITNGNVSGSCITLDKMTSLNDVSFSSTKANNFPCDDEDNPNDFTVDLNTEDYKILNKPKIQITSARVVKSDITERISHLERNNWIMDEKSVRSLDNHYRKFNYLVQENVKIETIRNKLLVGNLGALKPGHWIQFSQTECLPSLQLSFDADDSSFCSKLLKLFRCCK